MNVLNNMRIFLQSIALITPFSNLAQGAMPPPEVDVVIIGAGLSGLHSAYALKKAGLTYQILELTPHKGGRVRTVTYELKDEKITADSGMEEYWESNPAVELLQEMKLPLQSDTALSSLVLQKKINPLGNESSTSYLTRILGQSGLEALRAFKVKYSPLIKELHTGASIDSKTLKLKEVSFSEWILNQHLPPLVSEWIRVSIECEIGTEWTQISALDGLAEFHIFLGNGDDGEKNYRILGGNEQFTDSLSEAIGQDHISLNTRVNRIVSQPGKGVSVFFLEQTQNISSVIQAKYVISTIPLFRLFEIQFEPALSDKKRQAIASQGWGAYFKAHIFLPSIAEKFWNQKGNSLLPLLSDSPLGVIYNGNFDPQSKTKILSLLISGKDAEIFNMMPLDQVRIHLTDSLNHLWNGIQSMIQNMEFYRFHPRAIAAWPPRRSRFDALSNEIRRPENNIFLAGDFTESSHSDGALISSARAVKQILLIHPKN